MLFTKNSSSPLLGHGGLVPPGPLWLDGARGLVLANSYDVCNSWAQTFICVQPCRVLFLSSMNTGHIQDAGYSFSQVLG